MSLIGGPRGITDRDLRSGTGPGVGRTSFRFNYALVRAAWWQTGGFPRVPQLGGFCYPPSQLSVAGDQILSNRTWLDVT